MLEGRKTLVTQNKSFTTDPSEDKYLWVDYREYQMCNLVA
jgi:hypothetical protein